ELWQAITAGREWRGELFNRRKDGEFYWENCCIAPITDEEGGITHFVAVKEDMTERKRLEEELRRLATTDSLTGVANRRHFISITADEVTRCTRQAHPLSFLMVDVDHFKSVNDTYGHGIGDDALKRLAQTLTESMRPHDTVGRLGGEEFAIVLPEADAEEALAVAERLRQAVSEIVLDTDKGPLQFTCSIGAATYGAQDDGIESLMNRADDALYAAKTGGRNRVVRAER
ncbi:MAG: diguanylate cyclase, partial [Pseudomonadota bacterium]